MEPKHVVKLVIFGVIVLVFVIVRLARNAQRAEAAPPAPRRRGTERRRGGERPQRPARASSLALILRQWAASADPAAELPANARMTGRADVEAVAATIRSLAAGPQPLAAKQAEALIDVAGRIGDKETLIACDEILVPALSDLAAARYTDLGPLITPPMLVAKLLAGMHTPRASQALVGLTRRADLADNWLWQVVFAQVPDDGPGSAWLAGQIGQQLPGGTCAVTFLDLCNRLALARDDLRPHPFDQPEGWAMLKSWLRDPEHPSYAHSAAATLPFLSPQAYADLVPIAARHPDQVVRVETAWAMARTGDERGFAALVAAAGKVDLASRAIDYLEELGAGDRIPETGRDPGFRARAAVSAWLQHPNEYGRAPASTALRHRVRLHWPPCDEEREVFLVDFAIASPGAGTDRGVAIAGPTTFALRDQDLAELDPAEILGRYCAWELAARHDPRRPQQGDDPGTFGRHVLASYNPDAGLLRPGEALRPEYDFAGGTPGSSFDDSYATRPGRLTIDDRLLGLFHPDLYSDDGPSEVIKGLYGHDATGRSLREKLQEHLLYGDAQPAVVVRTDPLVVAAKSDELDCVVLLLCPSPQDAAMKELIELHAGARLVAVNTYFAQGPRQDDVVPGPETLGRYDSYWPVIGDFICSDSEALRRVRDRIPEEEWERTTRLARQAVVERGWMLRSARPLLSVLGGRPIDLDAATR